MDNQSIYPEFTVYTAYALFKELTGLSASEEQFLDFAHITLNNKIGHNVEAFKIKVTPDEEGVVNMPCTIKRVVAIVEDEQVFDKWDFPLYEDGKIVIDAYADGSHGVAHEYHTYVNFRLLPPNRIKVSTEFTDQEIYAAMVAVLTDEKGNVLLNYRQVEGLIWYVAYMLVERDTYRGIKTMDLAYARQKAINAVLNAKVPEIISDNEWDQVLNEKVSFGRKSFNRDFMFNR